MSPGRGFGEVEALQSVVPDPLAVVFALLTQFGDVWLLVAAIAGYYWYGDRTRGAVLSGIALGGLSLTVLLKSTFALGRPPAPPPVASDALPALVAPAYEAVVSTSSAGFPSGHAVGATVVWGGFAALLDVGTRRRRLAAAATVVAIVSLSRIVLGLHYGVDVVAGVAVGAAYLAGALALLRRVATAERPTASFAVGTAFALAAVAGTGGSEDAVVALGASLGALVGWRFADVPTVPWPRSVAGVRYAVLAVAGLGALGVAGYAVAAASPGPLALVTAFALAVLGVAVVVVAPAVASEAPA